MTDEEVKGVACGGQGVLAAPPLQKLWASVHALSPSIVHANAQLSGLIARDEADRAAMADICAPASVLAAAEEIGGMVAAARHAATPRDPDAGAHRCRLLHRVPTACPGPDTLRGLRLQSRRPRLPLQAVSSGGG